MDKLKHKEYDFSTKLTQRSVIERLKPYIRWQRGAEGGIPPYGPVSVNLDLTSACNFACPHCVDSGIINTGQHLDLKTVCDTVDTLRSQGLLSVILIGGGEPTLHRDFEAVVGHIKSAGIQLGIVTNGSRLARIAGIVDSLEKEDWVRISIDAGTEETFAASHQPRTSITLEGLLRDAEELKKRNPLITLGFSFVIVWDGITVNGQPLCPNIDEMALAARLASEDISRQVQLELQYDPQPPFGRIDWDHLSPVLRGIRLAYSLRAPFVAARPRRMTRSAGWNLQAANTEAAD